MLIPKLVVLFVIILIFIIYWYRGSFFINKYISLGLLIFTILGVIFSDSVYHAVNKRVIKYAQAPEGNRFPFISERWKQANPNNQNDNTRQMICDDFLHKHNLLGKSRNDILNLLGGSDSTTDFPGWDMKYSIGENQGSFNVEWLVIRLNENGMVDKYSIVSK